MFLSAVQLLETHGIAFDRSSPAFVGIRRIGSKQGPGGRLLSNRVAFPPQRETDMINCNYLLLMNTRIRAVACYSDFQASCNAPKPKSIERHLHALMCSVSDHPPSCE